MNKEIATNYVKVKIFNCDSENELEKLVNDFLSSISKLLLDIKYSASTSISEERDYDLFTAMIIYVDN